MVRMVLYPSREWLEEYRRRLNQSREYKEAGKGWGVGWNGDFIFQIDNIPINSISVEDLPADLAKELGEYVIDGTSYSYIQLEDGVCRGACPIKNPKDVEAGFIMKGSYENWKKLSTGEMEVMRGLLTRKFELEGNMARVMQYTRAAMLMTNISSSIKTEFIDEVYAKK
ncbi:MAG: SCP2 sterol-binding domain-containing protein [Candidatus Bathyarchaeota archaeon]|nr:MAG: SCP2 sterol-binding domain-containing protein [Candidatus Bathyarchaeota archaeon]